MATRRQTQSTVLEKSDTRVLVVEDRRLVGESVRTVLDLAGIEAELVDEADLGTIEEAVARFQPSIAVVAVGIGAGSLTEQVIGRLSESGIPVVIMSGGSDRMRLARCVEEGAIAILDKQMDVDTLIALIRNAGAASTILARADRDRIADELREYRVMIRAQRRPLETLTRREREVLVELSRGNRATEIAHSSCVSISTVRSQIKSILIKLGVHSQVQAVALANQYNWFSTAD